MTAAALTVRVHEARWQGGPVLVMKLALVGTATFAAETWAVASVTEPGGLAAQIAVLAAGAAGLHWLWKNLLRPAAKTLLRMAEAVETLEELPEWRRTTDRKIKHLERSVMRIGSGQDAMLRELGLEDQVRRTWEAEGELQEIEDDRERRGG